MTTLNAFLDQSSEALSAPPPQPVNVNQLLIRPFLVRIGLAALLVLPLITAPAYTRERGVLNREGVLATFAGAMAVYAVMLLASMALVATLFVYGTPEWAPIVSGYLGLLLIGAAFISAALFISSLATSAVAAGIATCAISLALGAATWLARSGAPGARPVFRYFSVGEALDDFSRRVLWTDCEWIRARLAGNRRGTACATRPEVQADKSFPGIAPSSVWAVTRQRWRVTTQIRRLADGFDHGLRASPRREGR